MFSLQSKLNKMTKQFWNTIWHLFFWKTVAGAELNCYFKNREWQCALQSNPCFSRCHFSVHVQQYGEKQHHQQTVRYRKMIPFGWLLNQSRDPTMIRTYRLSTCQNNMKFWGVWYPKKSFVFHAIRPSKKWFLVTMILWHPSTGPCIRAKTIDPTIMISSFSKSCFGEQWCLKPPFGVFEHIHHGLGCAASSNIFQMYTAAWSFWQCPKCT